MKMATKSATSNPATPINEQAAPVIEQAVLSFLDQLTTLATPITDLSEVAAKKDPLVGARTKFAANCDEAIKLIKASADTAKFFRKLPDGYLINFRNGNRSMELNGAAYFKVPNAVAAINLIEAAKAASETGELDKAFRDSAREPKKPKAEAAPTA
jgi:hypothetical protein